jgi:hypothetical protein
MLLRHHVLEYSTIIIIIIIIIPVILFTTVMQGIYNYTPETNNVSRVKSSAAVLYLQFAPHVMLRISTVKYVLYFYISTFRSTCAVPNAAVFCSSLISCFSGTLLRYCLSDFKMVHIAPIIIIITGIAFAFTFHVS